MSNRRFCLLGQVLTLEPLEAGRQVTHFMFDGPFGSSLPVMGGAGLRARGPRLLSDAEVPGWKRCELQVLDCQVGSRSGQHSTCNSKQPASLAAC
jgi:hypothetical protein